MVSLSTNNPALQEIEKLAVSQIMSILLLGKWNNIPKSNFIKAYSLVTQYCEEKNDTNEEYKRYVHNVFEQYLIQISKKFCTEIDDNIIELFITELGKWKILTNWIYKIFAYIDRYYIKKSGSIPKISLMLFRQNV